ncbi:MAG TPA: cobalamin B12-binding domain-containing protein, partial [Thermodesulfobacteriota bacterium]|nr:cobalamin B12-binding domain-containing protein [Thermodesulfobacteriota bacterium]
ALIYPYFLADRVQWEEVTVPPIGLYYLGAFLKEAGQEAEIWNWHDNRKSPENIRERLEAERPEVIGFSILQANRWGAIEIARISKELNPEVKIVLGGFGATFFWEHLLTHFKEIDFIVLGKAKFPWGILIRHLEKKDSALPEEGGDRFPEGWAGGPNRTLRADPGPGPAAGPGEIFQLPTCGFQPGLCLGLLLLRLPEILGPPDPVPLSGLLCHPT